MRNKLVFVSLIQLAGLIASLIYTRTLFNELGSDLFATFQAQVSLLLVFVGLEAAVSKASYYYMSSSGGVSNLAEIVILFTFITVGGCLTSIEQERNDIVIIGAFIFTSLLAGFALSLLNYYGMFILAKGMQVIRVLIKILMVMSVNGLAIFDVLRIEVVAALITSFLALGFIRSKAHFSLSFKLVSYSRVILGTALLISLDAGINAILFQRLSHSNTIFSTAMVLTLTLLSYYNTVVAIIPTTFTVNSLKTNSGISEIWRIQRNIVLALLIGWLLFGQIFIRLWLGDELYVNEIYRLLGLFMSISVIPVVLNSIFIHHENTWRIVIKPLGSFLTIVGLLLVPQIGDKSLSFVFVIGQPMVFIIASIIGVFSLVELGIRERSLFYLFILSVLSYVIFFISR